MPFGKSKLAALLLALALLTVPMAACTAGGGASSGQAPTAQVGENEDLDTRWDNSATRIQLDGDSATIQGTGATAQGAAVTISAAGTYVASGSLADGQIHVAAGENDLVRLVLNGADITCADGAAIWLESGRKLVVILAEGSENALTDGAVYTHTDGANTPDAALFSQNDLTINGSGALRVTGLYNNGIGAKDNLVLVSGSVAVSAANHGIRGRDSLTVLDGAYTVQAGNDGLQSNNANSADVGWILIEGGSLAITAAHDSIQAESDLTVTGGSFTLLAGGGAGASPTGTDEDGSTSYKGLKAGGSISITDGIFNIDTADDAVHANGSVTVAGGDFTIATGDDGMHADEALAITGGRVLITQSYEGLEGSTVSISGGEITLTASDDGINAAGGTDSNGEGRFGGDRFGADVSENHWIEISGGVVRINAAGDGIDSNGSARMSGGELYIDGPTSGGDGAIDYELGFAFTGGTLVAVGSAGMAMAPTEADTTQPTLMVWFTTTQPAGEPLRLEDESGNTLISHTPAKQYQTAVLSAAGMQAGGVYTLYVGDTRLGEVTLDGMLTQVNETGAAASGGMGMGGWPGGGMGGGLGGLPGEPPEGLALPDGFEPPEGVEQPAGLEPPAGGEMPDRAARG